MQQSKLIGLFSCPSAYCIRWRRPCRQRVSISSCARPSLCAPCPSTYPTCSRACPRCFTYSSCWWASSAKPCSFATQPRRSAEVPKRCPKRSTPAIGSISRCVSSAPCASCSNDRSDPSAFGPSGYCRCAWLRFWRQVNYSLTKNSYTNYVAISLLFSLNPSPSTTDTPT